MSLDQLKKGVMNLKDPYIARDRREEPISEEGQAPGRLKLWQAIMLAVVGLQLGPSIAFMPGALFMLSGYGSWLSIIIAFTLAAGVCEGIRLVSQADRSAKGLMSMVAASLGETAALYVKTCLLIGYVAAAASCVTTLVVFASSLMKDLGWSWGLGVFDQIIIVILVSLASGAMAYRGLEASLKTTMILGLSCLPIIASLIGLSLTHTGLHLRTQFAIDETALPGAMLGAVLIIAALVGIDGITSLADDTARPARNVSRIVYGTFAVMALGYFLSSITETPAIAASIEKIRLGMSPPAVLASTAGLPAFAVFIDLFLFLGTFAASVTVLTYGSRLFADAANANLLPLMFSQSHRRFASYHKSVILLGVAQAIVPIAGALFFKVAPVLSAIYIGISGAYLWAIPHAMICVGGLRVALRQRSCNILSYLAMAISIVGFVGILLVALRRPNADWQGLVSKICFASSILLFIMFCVKTRTRKLDRALA